MEGPGPRLSFAIEFGSNTVVNYGPWAHRQRYLCGACFVFCIPSEMVDAYLILGIIMSACYLDA